MLQVGEKEIYVYQRLYSYRDVDGCVLECFLMLFFFPFLTSGIKKIKFDIIENVSPFSAL